MKEMTQHNAAASIEKLLKEKGWHKYHRPGFLVSALSVECNELLDLCLWKTPDEIDELFVSKKKELGEELADIAINFLSLIKFLELDMDEIVSKKVDELLSRYKELSHGEHKLGKY